MTLRDALREGSQRLTDRGSDTPYLDAMVLLAEVLGVRKERLFAELADDLAADALSDFRGLIERRAGGIPIAYLTHRQEFYGRSFYVDERVLIPRGDTEPLVEATLELLAREPSLTRVHDLGTGSGCIALTLKAERPDLVVSASDASADACEVFRINAERLGLEVPLTEAPFFESLTGPFDVIVSNPPYLTDEEALEMAGRGWPEPQGALRAGPAGLDSLATIIEESVEYLSTRGRILLEAAPPQMQIIRGMLERAGYRGVSTLPDLAGRERVATGARDG